MVPSLKVHDGITTARLIAYDTRIEIYFELNV